MPSAPASGPVRDMPQPPELGVEPGHALVPPVGPAIGTMACVQTTGGTLCAATEATVACHGASPASTPAPATAAGCRPAATPSGSGSGSGAVFYCCPCAK